MAAYTSVGTTLAISAAAPATYDETGYAALTWTTIGEVGDLGDIPSKVYDIVSWRNIAARGETKAKGPFSIPDQTIMTAFDPDDAGQTLLTTASDSDTTYSVQISSPTMGDFYGRALVMGGTISFGDGSAVATRSVTLAYTIVSDTEDGLVYVAPA